MLVIVFISFILFSFIPLLINTIKMKNLTQWQVWVTKGSQPIIMSLPFNNVNTVFEFLCENLNKRPVSISKLN